MTPLAPSTYSAEYTGSDRATHSPHPSPSGPMTRTSRMSRSVSVPNDVWKGATRSSRMRRSSTSSIFIRRSFVVAWSGQNVPTIPGDGAGHESGAHSRTHGVAAGPTARRGPCRVRGPHRHDVRRDLAEHRVRCDCRSPRVDHGPVASSGPTANRTVAR